MTRLSTLTRTLLPIAAVGAALLALVSCSPLTAINALVSKDTYVLTAGVTYGPLHRQQLDIYTPTSAAPAGGWPVVVFFYGGTWNTGDRAEYKFVGEALAARGVLVVVPDYRLYPEVRYPEFLQDSTLGLAYGLKEAKRLGGDPARVFVMGHSSGAYNAAMLALDPRWLAATGHAPNELAGFIGLAGPYDFYPIDNPDAKPVFFDPNYPPHSQPIEFANAQSPRTFLGAAISDKLVNPKRNTEQMYAKLAAAGVPVTLKLYEHVSHATLIGAFGRPLRGLAPVLDDTVAFIEATPPKR